MHLRTDTATAQQHFAQVPTISHSRNAFTIAEKHVTTIQFDYLYPLYWKYIYPGDTLSVTLKTLARLQTQIAPLYDDLYIDVHAWYCPFRLLMEQDVWARFQFNAQPTGPSQNNSALTTPGLDLTTLGAPGFVAKTLYDYLGFPTEVDLTGTPTAWINNFLGRMYTLTWDQNYRDQNLQNAVSPTLSITALDVATNYPLLKRGKRFDRFTSCLTAQQKGTAATIPLGTSAPVYGAGAVTATTNAQLFQMWNATDGATQFGDLTKAAAALTMATGNPWTGLAAGDDAGRLSLGTAAQYTSGGATYSPPYADLTAATASANINLLRYSVAVQHLLEADSRGGTRDVEAIKHRWGVTVPDFRLQRVEYIAGATWLFDQHLVPQTSSTSGSNYQAGLAGFSQTLNSLNINHSFQEHGAVMILASARSNITYQEGLLRELSYKTRYDFFQPEFANLGEVAVKNKEIYLQGTSADESTFGYQEYAYELRYSMNRVTGEMRSNYATSLDSRHMADDYASLPTLGSAWIVSNTAITRNIAVAAATADPIQFSMETVGKIARTLPMYSIPGLTRL